MPIKISGKWFWFLGTLLLWSCDIDSQKGIDNGFSRSKKVTATMLQEGRRLAQNRCGTCHVFPEPDLLDKNSWEHYVLPTMGYRLGLYHRDPSLANGIRRDFIEKGLAGELVEQANIFPKTTTISPADFGKIIDYYLTLAPAKPLRETEKRIILPELPQFKTHFPNLPYRPAQVTLVKIDTAARNIYLGLLRPNSLLRLDATGKLLQTLPLLSAASDYLVKPAGNYALNIGSFFPSDAPAGNLSFYPEGQIQPKVLLKNLQRPVQVQLTHIKNKHQYDFLICEFGNQTGSLNWYEWQPGNTYARHILKKAPGAVRAYVQDLNHDNRPDVIALMAQGNEGIFIFYNLGEGQFREEQVLQFSPAMGSSYFELIDFNHDGHPDILYTAGDNADFTPVYKRYHGIRLFLNNGQNQFNQAYFFPQSGSYKATAADFDQDGDLDIASIAFFARFAQTPQESFVYLENQGNFKFKAATFRGSHRGRWLTLDKGDIDGDNDTDLILGSFVLPTQLATPEQNSKWATESPALVILENKIR